MNLMIFHLFLIFILNTNYFSGTMFPKRNQQPVEKQINSRPPFKIRNVGPSRSPSMFCWKIYQGGNLAARSFCTKPSNQSPGRMVLTMLRISRTKRGLVSNQQRLFPSQRKRTFTGLCQVVNLEQSPPSTQYTIVYEIIDF